MRNLDAFTRGYIVCALWAPGGEYDLDDVSITDLPAETLARLVEDARDFQETNAELLSQATESLTWAVEDGAMLEYLGHDFWLTRNHHGAGFWDRGLGVLGEQLTAMAHSYGECSLYQGDDGLIYLED